MTYWKDRKKDWDVLLNDWNAKNSFLEPRNTITISNYDNELAYELKTEDETIELPELKVERDDKHKEDTITIVKSALVQEVKVFFFLIIYIHVTCSQINYYKKTNYC